MESKRIETFDDWKDTFQAWQKDINYDTKLFTSVPQGYEFNEKFGDPKHAEIGFGEFSGARKWQNTNDIPRPEIKDLLLRLIAIQGDTEFASVKLQRKLLDSAPAEKDLRSIVRINAEEMRHGWQMSYLLVRYFGDEGKAEAGKLLERRADKRERLLGAPLTSRWKIGSISLLLLHLSIGMGCISSKCSAIPDLPLSATAWDRC